MSDSVTPTPTTPSSATTWGAILVTVLIFLAFFAFIGISVYLKLPDLINNLSTVAAQGVTFALGYWIGGSRGSTDKTAALQTPPTIIQTEK
jgi:hypothetical protein